ncbi:cytochrome P450 [Streptomyces acidiscabies]|uniref:cytochrome P450 n=1 Tax=Streptomyces acidiscabies TaxID=42234 RepID=UPI000950DD56|nr:cytochrome P450 [Streptomyces acidiscabies]
MTDLTDTPPSRPPNELLLLDADFLADPAASFGAVREQGPVVRGWLTETQPVWLVTRYDDVREGLRDHARFVHTPAKIDGHTGEDPRRVLVDMLNLPEEMRKYFLVSALDADPPAHTRLRGAVARTFTARRMQALRPRIAEITHDLLTEALANSVDGTLELVEIETITRLLDERRPAPGEDLLSGLACGLDEVEAVAMVMNIVMAGYDNTAQLPTSSSGCGSPPRMSNCTGCGCGRGTACSSSSSPPTAIPGASPTPAGGWGGEPEAGRHSGDRAETSGAAGTGLTAPSAP